MKQTDGKYLSKRNNQRQGKFYNKDANSIHKLNFQNKPNESPKKKEREKRGKRMLNYHSAKSNHHGKQ